MAAQTHQDIEHTNLIVNVTVTNGQHQQHTGVPVEIVPTAEPLPLEEDTAREEEIEEAVDAVLGMNYSDFS